MCEWGTTTLVRLATPRRSGRTHVPVDACIAPLVQALNDAGIGTEASCCGHGSCPGTVLLTDGRQVVVTSHPRDAMDIVALAQPIRFPEVTYHLRRLLAALRLLWRWRRGVPRVA